MLPSVAGSNVRHWRVEHGSAARTNNEASESRAWDGLNSESRESRASKIRWVKTARHVRAKC